MSVITRAAPKSQSASIEITAWPLRDRPAMAWTTLGVLVAVALVVGSVTRSGLLATLATAAAALSAWRIFVPQRYEFSPSGITRQVWRRKRRIAWTAIGRWESRAGGLYLLPATAEAPIDALHGLYIPIGEERDEVLKLVERHTARAGNDTSTTRRLQTPSPSSARLEVDQEERPA